MTIDRDELDRLVARVDRLELGQPATVELVASEIVGLGTDMDERFARVDERFDRMDERFGVYDGQVGLVIEVGNAAVAENRRANDLVVDRFDALIRHLDIQMPGDEG